MNGHDPDKFKALRSILDNLLSEMSPARADATNVGPSKLDRLLAVGRINVPEYRLARKIRQIHNDRGDLSVDFGGGPVEGRANYKMTLLGALTTGEQHKISIGTTAQESLPSLQHVLGTSVPPPAFVLGHEYGHHVQRVTGKNSAAFDFNVSKLQRDADITGAVLSAWAGGQPELTEHQLDTRALEERAVQMESWGFHGARDSIFTQIRKTLDPRYSVTK